MKTVLTLITARSVKLTALFLLLSATTLQAQFELSFRTYSLASGTDRQPGCSYRFYNVKPGIDAMVKFESAVNGAKLDSVDQVSSGFLDGFQPLVSVPARSNGYLLFEITFVATNSNSNVTLNTVTHTAIDIDGHKLPGDSLFEWEAVNMGNGQIKEFTAAINSLSVTQQGNWITGVNIEGKEYDGIDTAAKNVMFSVSNSNINKYQIRVGVDNRSGGAVSRQRSSIHKRFSFSLVSNPLPLKMNFFSAWLNNNRVDLKWQTLNEVNVNYFQAERSTDGINYSPVAMVFAIGNSSDKSDYSCFDNVSAIQSGVIYYRLRSVDNDGKTEFSEIRVIRIGKTNNEVISILAYPNPATSTIKVTVPSGWQNKKAVFEILGLNGQVMNRTETANTSQTELINISKLSAGVYFVKVSCEGQVAQQKIIKQ